MELKPGAKLGPYEILVRIGESGRIHSIPGSGGGEDDGDRQSAKAPGLGTHSVPRWTDTSLCAGG
jgi:hypothetical protein